MRKLFFVVLLAIGVALLAGCSQPASQNSIETRQQDQGTTQIVRNQPVPDLGGYSRERDLAIRMMLARNNDTVTTWSYIITLSGVVLEVCPSIGYGIPYSAQLTSPDKIIGCTDSNGVTYNPTGGCNGVVAQSEANTLYTPDSAAATWVMCVVNGKQVPTYIEDDVDVFTYRIKADKILAPVDGPDGIPSLSLDQIKVAGGGTFTDTAAPNLVVPTQDGTGNP